MPLRPKFLDAIRDKAFDKLKQTVTPNIRTSPTALPGKTGPEGEDVEVDEALPQSFFQKIKEKAKEKLRNFSPVQKKMLDPNAKLDLATIKFRARYAAERNLLILATYNNSSRYIEIYSWRIRGKRKRLMLMALCRAHGVIHSFLPDKFTQFVVTDIPFHPKWTVELV